MTAKPKYMDISEFREAGFLQEANRLFFHPLGLALEVAQEECERCGGDGLNPDNTACEPCGGSGFTERISGIWDHRDDPEGIAYCEGYGLDPDKAAYVDAERGVHAAHRFELFGLDELPTFHWAIQPLEKGD